MDSRSHSQDHASGMHDGHGMWVEGGTPYHSHHQSPQQEYSGFAFNTMPIEPLYANHAMPPPARAVQPQLHPLVTTPWPSMLTSQSNYGTPVNTTPVYTTPSVSPPVPTTPMSAPVTTGRSYDRPRKTLTDERRRAMCVFAEQHPEKKQNEIGLEFGVERSTVSKVLRNKEKYLAQDDTSKSPQKTKGKCPDIERTLSVWAKNEEDKHGRPVSDNQIVDKFWCFAQTTKDPDQQWKSVINDDWLEAFKRKHGLGGGPKSRKASVVDDVDAKPSTESPTSPQIKRGPSPSRLRGSKGEKAPKKLKSESPPTRFGETMSGHRPYSSIGGALTDVHPSAPYSTDALGPSFGSTADAFDSQHLLQSGHIPGGLEYQPRPRSQTFPIRASNDNGPYSLTPTASEAQIPNLLLPHTSSQLGTTSDSWHVMTTQESFMPTPSLSKDVTMSPQSGHPTSSPMTPADTVIPSVASASHENRPAPELALEFFQQKRFGPQELAAVGSLIQRLLKLPSEDVTGIPGGAHSTGETIYGLGYSMAE